MSGPEPGQLVMFGQLTIDDGLAAAAASPPVNDCYRCDGSGVIVTTGPHWWSRWIGPRQIRACQVCYPPESWPGCLVAPRPRPIRLDGCTCGGIGDTGSHRAGCPWGAR